MTTLKLGDKVTNEQLGDGEVVAVLSRPDKYGNTLVILADSDSAAFLRKPDGRIKKDSQTSYDFTKKKKKVTGTVYLNVYKNGAVSAYADRRRAEGCALHTAEAVAVPAHYEYEVEE